MSCFWRMLCPKKRHGLGWDAAGVINLMLKNILKPGTIVAGKYKILHLIAEGGMSEVYLSVPCQISDSPIKMFALKRLMPSLANNPIHIQLFRQEADLALMLSHPNLVHCYDFVVHENNYFMVMEYISGKEVGELFKLIHPRSLIDRLRFCTAIGLEVARALCYVHNKTDNNEKPMEIVHGDISPQNIKVSIVGVVKVYDFGAAKTCAQPMSEEIVRGNIRYMSPEQASGLHIDAKSDHYSLALVMLESVFKDAIKVKTKQGSICFQQMISELQTEFQDAAQFFRRSLAFNRNERFTSMEEFLVSLQAIASKLGLKDDRAFLTELITSTPPQKEKPIVRRQPLGKEYGSFIFLGMFSLGIGFFVWMVVTICSDFFEPKFLHNIPHWAPEEQEGGRGDIGFYKEHVR